jgi:aldose 1-epimerase
MRRVFLSVFVMMAAVCSAFAAENYSVEKKTVEGYTTYHLVDAQRKMEVGIVPQMGNVVYEFKVNTKDALIPVDSLKEFLAERKVSAGMAFLAPWANRIDQDYYYFNGKKYLLNDSLGNLPHIAPYNMVIHGLLVFSPHWRVVKQGASDAEGAFITSRLGFYKYPDLMAQFPFAQVYEITYRLKDGKLENTTRLTNKSAVEIPVFFGYHPYFRPDGPREDWRISINARLHWKIDNRQRVIPTGETEPVGDYIAHNTDFMLGKTFIGDEFSDTIRDAGGLARYVAKGKTEKVQLVFGKGYDFVHVYAPLDNTLICFEPSTGPTNAFNLNHEGKFPGLVVLKPGQTFEAHFWIVPSGF